MSTTAKEVSRTAEDTLAQKSRDSKLVSGGHLVAKALKNGCSAAMARRGAAA